jgi:putative ABC transport system permease protein
MLLAHRWFSAAVVVTLALGIGVNTMVFTLINAVLLKPLPVPDGARVVSVRNSKLAGNDDGMRMSYPDFRDYRAQAASFASLQAASDEEGVLSERTNAPQSYQMEHVTSGMFSMLQMQPILGRGFLPADDKAGAEPVLLLGYGIWQERYNSSPGVIGRVVRVNGKPATIIGVMPRGFKFPTVVDMWVPLVPTAELEQRTNRSLQLFGRLKPGVTIPQASAEMNGIAQRLARQYPDTNKDLGASVMSFHDRFNGGNVRVIFLLMLTAVAFVLLVACANVSNMMLSRGLSRQREMSIRTALGGTRWRVVRQLLIESLALSLLGGLVGLSLALLGTHWFDLSTQNVGKPYFVTFTMDYTVFAYFAAICVFSGLLFGMVPALRASQVDLNDVLKDGGRAVGKHQGGRLSALLVVFQFAVTVVLLSGAGIFVHSLLNSLAANQSVPATELMTARLNLPDDRYKDAETKQRFYDQLLPRLKAIPGVMNAALTSDLPGLGAASSEIEVDHASADNITHRPSIGYGVQSPGYFDAIQLPILSGRDFNQLDGTKGHLSAVLTRSCAQHFWPNQSPLGKRFRLYDDNKAGDWITVVGVSTDIVQEINEKNPKPLLFLPFRQKGWGGMALVVRTSGPNPIASVRSAVQSLDQDLPLHEVDMLPQAISHRQWSLHVLSKVFTAFAIIALLMAAVGIFAVIAQATNGRTQEIGVRMALGANTRNILALVMKRGVLQIAAGLGVGLALAVPAMHWMGNLPIGISQSDPLIFIVVATVLSIVGLFACWLPARKAAALDPVKAIRYE